MAADELVLALDPASSDSEVGDFDVIDLGGVITSPLVLAGDTLIMATEGGVLVGVDVSAKTVDWSFDVGTEIRAPVAVVGGAIIAATTQGDLIALADR